MKCFALEDLQDTLEQQHQQKHSEDHKQEHECDGAGGGFGDVSGNEVRIPLLIPRARRVRVRESV